MNSIYLQLTYVCQICNEWTIIMRQNEARSQYTNISHWHSLLANLHAIIIGMANDIHLTKWKPFWGQPLGHRMFIINCGWNEIKEVILNAIASFITLCAKLFLCWAKEHKKKRGKQKDILSAWGDSSRLDVCPVVARYLQVTGKKHWNAPVFCLPTICFLFWASRWRHTSP